MRLTGYEQQPRCKINQIYLQPYTLSILELQYTLDTINAAAKQFWERFKDYRILAFTGEMGAGKTTFIHALCDYLHVQDTVSSPTFALINEYHFTNEGKDNIIYHLDWYRLKDTAEAISAGMEDCILQAKNKVAYCFIEWPEKAAALLNPPYISLNIETMSTTTRKMTVKIISEG